MNEANLDKDFEAAVIQLRQGQRRAWMKFGAIVILVTVFGLGIVGFSFSVASTVKEMVGVKGSLSAVPEADVP